MRRFHAGDFLWLTLWIALLAAVAAAMFYVRYSVLQSASVQTQREWEAWRESVKEGQGQDAPVQRRVPKSEEPPAIVLLRDHFTVCLIIALVLSSVLFGTFLFLVRGVMHSPGPSVNSPSLPLEYPSDDRR